MAGTTLDSPRQGLHAIMMEASDLTTFGHCIKAHFEDIFAKHGDALAQLKVNADNGLGYLYDKIAGYPKERETLADAEVAHDTRTGIVMVVITLGSREIVMTKAPVEKDIEPETPVEKDIVPKAMTKIITENEIIDATGENCQAAPGRTRQPPLAEPSRPIVQDYAVLRAASVELQAKLPSRSRRHHLPSQAKPNRPMVQDYAVL